MRSPSTTTSIDATGRRYGFYPFLMLLMTGVGGSFLTGDIFNLYVWFEVMLITTLGLITLDRTRAQLDGALKYAVLNLFSTILFLMAIGLLYGVTGTLNMADMARLAPDANPAAMGVIAALLLLAFGGRSDDADLEAKLAAIRAHGSQIRSAAGSPAPLDGHFLGHFAVPLEHLVLAPESSSVPIAAPRPPRPVEVVAPAS